VGPGERTTWVNVGVGPEAAETKVILRQEISSTILRKNSENEEGQLSGKAMGGGHGGETALRKRGARETFLGRKRRARGGDDKKYNTLGEALS